MSEEMASLALQVVFTIIGGGTVAALINFFLTRPKVRAEAANLVTQSTSKVIEDLDKHNDRLSGRIDGYEKDEITARDERLRLEGKIRALTDALWNARTWMARAYSGSTPEQKAEYGDPPNTDPFFQ